MPSSKFEYAYCTRENRDPREAQLRRWLTENSAYLRGRIIKVEFEVDESDTLTVSKKVYGSLVDIDKNTLLLQVSCKENKSIEQKMITSIEIVHFEAWGAVLDFTRRSISYSAACTGHEKVAEILNYWHSKIP